jgi:hypothetical protein
VTTRMTATGGDSPAIVRVLLSAGADVNATTKRRHERSRHQPRRRRHRRNDAGRATANDDVADLLVAHGATY